MSALRNALLLAIGVLIACGGALLRRAALSTLLIFAAVVFPACQGVTASALLIANRDWPVVGSDAGNTKFSPLDQIDRSNVARLEVAWVYRTGDVSPGRRSEIQANPVVIGGVLYATTPGLHAFALDAATGEELWRFDPFVGRTPEPHVNRGVAYWREGREGRIFFSAGSRLYALDAATGRPIPEFGGAGWIDLREGLGRDPATLQVSATSPGIVYHDLLIQGTRVPEGENGAPGHIRAYDVRTGEMRWIFHTIPHPGEYGYETWAPDSWLRNGGANAWAGLSLDVGHGIVYAPTGSASYDFFGGDRPGANLFANTVLALDARTGKRVWHYQVVRHDILDYDLPAPPTLVSVLRDGQRVDALAQITKTGHVFVLDRLTGEPLFPVEERLVPPSEIVEERAWPTQPIPLLPEPFARQSFTEADITDISPEARAYVLERLRRARTGRLFTPLSLDEMVVVPGMNGGAQWGGAAWDPESGILYVNGNDLPYITRLLRRSAGSAAAMTPGEAVFAAQCASCHGSDLRGDDDRIPTLVGLASRLAAQDVLAVIERGRGLMPSFAPLPETDKRALVAYLLGQPQEDVGRDEPRKPYVPGDASPYRFGGYNRFHDSEGYPAIKPPWGTLSAYDLHTGETVWRVPLGEFPELTARGVPPTGTTNYGGPVVTAGGLLFIAATMDAMIRAFDKRTGEVLWERPLPAAGYATPSTYMVNGRQYLVIAAGGGKAGTPSGDSYVAFALAR
jgi:quinoprotein glucose dehydrogenase